MRVRTRRDARRGFTLIECLVVLSIVGLLAALVTVAVQQARESSRRIACVAHLREIGIALANHQGAHGNYPSSMAQPGPRPTAVSPTSAHCRLLPYLDQLALYNSLNLELAREDDSIPVAHNIANDTAARVRLGVFVCPSDSENALGPGNNYRACCGPHPLEFEGSLWPGGEGAFPGFLELTPAQYTDGLSHTAGFSERLLGSRDKRFRRERDVWFSHLFALLDTVTSDDLRKACAAAGEPPAFSTNDLGRNWIHGVLDHTVYNHVAPPNWRVADCSATQAGPINGVSLTARSAHPGGVNVLFMDGGVRFVRDSIAVPVWAAMATRAGGETVNMEGE